MRLKLLTILSFLIFTISISSSCQINPKKTAISSSISKTNKDSIPQPIGYVNDYENILTDSEEQVLDSLIREFQQRTTIQIAFITLDTTMTTSENFDIYTLNIARTWGVGENDKNNGVVIGVSKGYRQMRIQNAFGIEKILSDDETKQIIETAFIPHYKAGEYFKGTYEGLTALMSILKERYK